MLTILGFTLITALIGKTPNLPCFSIISVNKKDMASSKIWFYRKLSRGYISDIKTVNPQVPGSSPGRGAKFSKAYRLICL